PMLSRPTTIATAQYPYSRKSRWIWSWVSSIASACLVDGSQTPAVVSAGASPPFELRLALLGKGAAPLLVILACVGSFVKPRRLPHQRFVALAMCADGSLGRGDGQRRTGTNPFGDADDHVVQLACWRDPMRGAKLESSIGSQLLARQEQQMGGGSPINSQESSSPARVIAKPEASRRHRKPGSVGNRAQVTRGRDRYTGTHAGAVDERYGRTADR